MTKKESEKEKEKFRFELRAVIWGLMKDYGISEEIAEKKTWELNYFKNHPVLKREAAKVAKQYYRAYEMINGHKYKDRKLNA